MTKLICVWSTLSALELDSTNNLVDFYFEQKHFSDLHEIWQAFVTCTRIHFNDFFLSSLDHVTCICLIRRLKLIRFSEKKLGSRKSHYIHLVYSFSRNVASLEKLGETNVWDPMDGLLPVLPSGVRGHSPPPPSLLKMFENETPESTSI